MDEALFQAINGLAGQSAMADWFMLALAQPSNLLFPGVLVFAYWVWTDKRQAIVGSLTLTAVILINDFIGAQLKHLVARPRPCRIWWPARYRCGGVPARGRGIPHFWFRHRCRPCRRT